MKKILSSILLPLTLIGMVGVGAASAAGEYPIKHPKELDWSFAGPFGNYDKGQLQRGLKIFTEACAACHSMNLVAFRSLEDLGYSKEQVKSFAADYRDVPAEPNIDGDVEDRPARPTDVFGSPFDNVEQAAASNNGAVPPDFSLIAKARYVERGFPQFVFDIFTGYQEAGPNYIYSLITGYEDPPEGVEVAEGTNYNPYFISGSAIAMAAPISEGQVSYDDGTPETLDQYAKDVSAFLMWAAEPHLGERKRIGFMVISFMLLLTILVYLTKKSIYSRIKH